MIRTKGNGNGSRRKVEERDNRGRSGLSAHHPPERINSTETAPPYPACNLQSSPYWHNPPKEYQFKPGNPGGPGRPPYKVLTQELWKQLEKVDKKTNEPKYIALICSIIDKAIGKSPGSGYAAQLIFDRVEGLLKQRMEVTGLIGVVPIPLGDLNGDLKKLSDAELMLAERVGLLALQRARQLEQQREREG